ncbi:MAG: late competence development ComFB family protein [SAR324 cluster bacterium]|nr:late competence development ComFB family protein [SAR324 cluster bacterium]
MEEKYQLGTVSLAKIRNKNELRVISLMPEVLKTLEREFKPDIMDIEDIYALTLNNLAPRYVQNGSIVMNEVLKDEIICDQIRAAVRVVSERPKH